MRRNPCCSSSLWRVRQCNTLEIDSPFFSGDRALAERGVRHSSATLCRLVESVHLELIRSEAIRFLTPPGKETNGTVAPFSPARDWNDVYLGLQVGKRQQPYSIRVRVDHPFLEGMCTGASFVSVAPLGWSARAQCIVDDRSRIPEPTFYLGIVKWHCDDGFVSTRSSPFAQQRVPESVGSCISGLVRGLCARIALHPCHDTFQVKLFCLNIPIA